eukprot:GILJ01004809.1.p2 GENE.GILJ01004809.1~~GILJ01004809.1.p2  ORF type:complete len:186 (+),score=18.85 GILJ01004809.1:365-922(+)
MQACLHLRGNAEMWANSLSEEDRNDYARLSAALRANFSPAQEVMLLGEVLMQRMQGPYESVESYGLSLQQLMRRVDNAMSEADRVRHFIRGLLPRLKKHVLLASPITFDSALPYGTAAPVVFPPYAYSPLPPMPSSFAGHVAALESDSAVKRDRSPSITDIMAKLNDRKTFRLLQRSFLFFQSFR